jgi:delta 1-pyrroline-5-carboxylate dehydrogenase
MGPLASEQQRSRVEGYISAGVAKGAKLLSGGRRPRDLDRGFFVEPTVFARVDNDYPIAREEILGPVLSVIPQRTRHRRSVSRTTQSTGSTRLSSPPSRARAAGCRTAAVREGWS